MDSTVTWFSRANRNPAKKSVGCVSAMSHAARCADRDEFAMGDRRRLRESRWLITCSVFAAATIRSAPVQPPQQSRLLTPVK